jgi:hypothetical protein
MVEITRDLNIHFSIRNKTIHIHSMPIRYEVFETYYMPISIAFSDIYVKGLEYAFSSGPRVASLVLRDASKKLGMWEGNEGVKNGLINEIHRLTNVIMPSKDQGWQTHQFSDLLRKNVFTYREVAEIEGILIFFTCVSLMQPQEAAPKHLRALSLWGVQTTSSNVTELCASLMTSMTEENSTKKIEESSVPS